MPPGFDLLGEHLLLRLSARTGADATDRGTRVLQVFARLAPTPLEQVESVDMMRAVEHGYRVRAVEIHGATIGVDVPGDIARAEKALGTDPLVTRYLGR
jgi:hypothetical protein